MRHLFTHTLTHQRLQVTEDQWGNRYEQWVTLGTIRGRLRTASVSERTAAGLVAQVVEYVLYTGPEVDIRRGDRVILGDTVVEITFVRNPSFAGHHLEAEGKAVLL